MREALVFLTHLDIRGTEDIMREKLWKQVDGSEWSLKNLSVLCWAIGSILGVILYTTYILVMYVVGQYPKFLQGPRKFFRVVAEHKLRA